MVTQGAVVFDVRAGQPRSLLTCHGQCDKPVQAHVQQQQQQH